MDAIELQQLLAEKIGDKESRELIYYIENRPDLATKQDLQLLKHDFQLLSKDMEKMEERMQKYTEKAIGSLAWKVAGFLVAQAAVIVILVKLL